MFDFLQGTLSSLGRKYTMAVTGFLLGVFLLIHAVGNSFVFIGKDAFNAYAEQLHSLGPLVPVAEILLLIIFLSHIFIGITLFLKNQDAAGSRYAVKTSSGGETWGSRTMPWTGLIILAFLLLHLFNVRFVDQILPIADVVEQTLAYPLYTFLYLAGITALILHISHGFWSLLQTWGVYHPRHNSLVRSGAYLLTTLICMVFLGVIVFLW
ncbi:Succinate dehydrogenase subunit C [Candidatus Electrothrix aarhusensis]|jgi:succinate dehydrogenase / fumarate reductase cytochrome b subunit